MPEVPVHTTDAASLGQPRLRLSLCLLTWNEIEGCKHDVPHLPVDLFNEVYAIDGGSHDGTVEFLKARGIAVHQQPARGYNQAYLHAFKMCATDAVVLYHPKGSVDPAEVIKFISLFNEGYDLIIASRMISGATNEEDDKFLRPRKWFVLGIGLLASLLWRRNGPVIWDVLHGFRGMRRDRFQEIDLLPVGLSADLEMVVRGYRKGYRMIEIPISERPRLAGETHFKAFRTGRLLLSYLLRELKRPT